MPNEDFLRNHQIPNRIFDKSIDAIRAFTVDSQGRENFISYFGELLTTEKRIIEDIKSYYGISDRNTNSGFQNVNFENGDFMFSVSSSDLNADAFIETKKVVRYVASTVFYSTFSLLVTGLTADQETPEIDDQIIWGQKSESDGFGLGFVNGKFSFIRRKSGENIQVVPCQDFDVDITQLIDFSKINIFRIISSWHASSPVICSVQKNDGKWIDFYTAQYANSLEGPHTGVPNTPARVELKSPKNSGIGFSLVAMSIAELGPKSRAGLKNYNLENERDTSGVNDLTTMIYLKNKTTYKGILNKIAVRLEFLSVAAESNRPMRFKIILNPTISNEGTLQDVDTNDSVMQVSYDAGDVTAGTGFKEFGITIPGTGGDSIDIEKRNILIPPGETAAIVASSGANNLASVNINYAEFY